MPSAWTLLSWGPEGWLDDIARGVFVTVALALATLPIGLLIGFFVALAKQSQEPSLRLAGNIYTTIFRGLPELLTLFLVYFGVQIGLQNVVRVFMPDATVEVNSFVSGMVALGVVFSSYASEVFLSAFRAIPHFGRIGDRLRVTEDQAGEAVRVQAGEGEGDVAAHREAAEGDRLVGL
jgi:polar amino acid transport system permease protein